MRSFHPNEGKSGSALQRQGHLHWRELAAGYLQRAVSRGTGHQKAAALLAGLLAILALAAPKPAHAAKTITLSVSSATVDEGDSGRKDVTISYTLGETTANTLGFDIQVIAASTTATDNTNSGSTSCTAPSSGADVCYPGGLSGSVYKIINIDANGSFTIGILGDTRDEPNETFAFRLTPNALGRSGGWTQSSNTITLTITDDDGPAPGVTISAETLAVTAGASKTYTVVLDSDPGAQVVVTPTSTPVAKATVSGALTFTTATNNWSTAQTVTVTGVAAGTATIEHTITGYTGVDDDDIDDVEVTVNAAPAVAAPVLTTATSTTSGEINLTWTHAGSSAGALAQGATGFDYWQVSHRLKGATSWMAWGDSTLSGGTSLRTVAASLGNAYPDGAVVEVRMRAVGYKPGITPLSTVDANGPWSNTRTVTYKNDNLDALTFSGSSVTVAVNDTATYTVKLTKAYGGVLSLASSDTTKVTVSSPATLTFTTSTYNTAQTVTVTGVATGGSPQINHSFRLTGATADAIPDAGSVGVTVNAAAPAGVTISADTLTVTAGASKTYTVVLDSDPGAQVVVTPTSSPTTKATVSGALTFTTATNNWSTAKTVTVTGVAAGTATISHTITGYTGVDDDDIDDVEVTVGAAAAKTITLTADSTTITEGDSGTKDVVLTATLGQAAPSGGVSGVILFTDQGTTATGSDKGANPCDPPLNPADTDYCYPSGTQFTIAQGQTKGTVTVKIFGDNRDESDETIRFVASATGGGWTPVNSLTITIKDDDGKKITLTADSTTITEGDSGTKDVVLTATLGQAAPSGGVSGVILFTDQGTTATGSDKGANPCDPPLNPADTDYCYPSGTQFTIAQGQTKGTVTVKIFGDNRDESDETIRFVASATGGGWTPVNSLTITIKDDDGKKITLTADSTTITEGDSGTKDVVLTVTLGQAAPSGGVSGVILFTDQGTTATGSDKGANPCDPPLNPTDTDYCYPSGTQFTIAQGQTKGTVTVKIFGDNRDESDETIRFVASATGGGWTPVNSLTITIKDDDGTTTSVPAAPTGFSAEAGNAQVTLTWDDPDNDDITEYKVRYGKKTARRNAEWATISGSDADTTEYTVRNLQNGSEYSFKVRAVSSAGDGAATDWLDAMPVAPVTIQPPTGLTVVSGPDRLYLSWTKPTDANRTGWRVRYRQLTGPDTYGNWSEWTAISNAAATSYTITGLTRGTYQVALEATGASNAASTAATVNFLNTESGIVQRTDTGAFLRVNEGGTKVYDIRLKSRGTASVTVTPSSANTDLSFSPTALTFTTANWGTNQAVTVTAAKDETTDNETASISYTVSGGNYPAITQTLSVQITDTTPTLQLSTDPSAVSEGTPISLTVTSDRTLTGTLPVRLTLAARDSSTFTAADIPGPLGPRTFNADFGSSPGGTTGTVSIPTSTDADATEGAEAYRITLSDAAGYAVGTDVTAEGVLNDGTAATVSVPATVTVAEGVSGAKAVVTITTPRAFGASTTFNVSYGRTSSTADADARGRGNPSGSNNGDYDNNDVTAVTFSATEKTKAIEIPIRNDKLDEEDETFTVTIAAAAALPDGFSLGNATTVVTITDDDNTPVLQSIEDVNLKQGQAVDITAAASDADGDTVTYTWTRKASETAPAIPGGTGLNAARLNFTPPGTGTYTMTVTASDGTNEATEEVIITVSNANVVQVPERVAVDEGDGNAVVRITTAEAFGQAVTFNVSYGSTSVTSDNDATGAANPASGDYDNDAVTSVTFNSTETTKDIVIPITDDDLDEENETFTVTIAPAAALPSGFQLARATTTVTITDDDNTPVLAAIENVTLKQGQAVDITAAATDADGDTVTYTWTRKDGESTPPIPGGTGLAAARLKFTPPGTGTYTMTVTASDGTNEDTEEVIITVTDANVVRVPERVEVGEGDGNAVVPITTTEAFGQAVTFTVTYGSTSTATDNDATGAANPDSGDYDNDAVTSVRFNSTETTKNIEIPISDDQAVEGNETFTVTIAPAAALPGGFDLARATTVVTITDNDTPGGGGGGGGSTPSSVPAAPTGVGGSAASTGNGQVTLTWANPGDSTIRKWQVQRREIGSPTGARLGLEAASYRTGGQQAPPAQEGGSYGPWRDIPNSTASTTSHTVTGLTNGKTYGFRIRAVNTAGRSGAPSAEIRVTLRQAPSKPTGVTATPGNGQVTLAWNNPDNATITKWQVQRKEGSGSYGAWRDIPNSTASTTSHTVTGLTNGVAYSFRIRAVNAAGNGAPSDEVTATPIDQDMVQADKARSQALAATSRTLLGMATDVLGSRSGGEAPVALAGAGGSMGEQAMGIVEEVLGTGGSELPTSLTLEEVEDRLWSQSFQLTPPSAEEGSTGQQSWAFWGAGELRSYRSEGEEGLSSSGNLKTAWLGVDYPFTHRGLAGLALSFSTGQSDYTYRKTDGSTDGGRMDTRLTAFYPYGSFQVSRQLRLWAMAGIGWGSQHHQQTGDDAKAEGDLRLQMGVVGFEQALSPIGDVNLSLAGDAGLVKSTTTWQGGSGLGDLSVTLHRIRMGVDGSFPLAEHTTGYVNVKGRMDGGDLSMNAAELVAGVQYSQARFSGFLQGRQVYAFDGSYAESGLTAQLRLTANSDGTGLGWTLQPSYGAGTGNGDVALAAGPSLWTDEQLESLTGAGAAQQEGQHLEWSSRVGYGIRLESSDLLLTPFTEVRLWEGSSHRIGLGLTVEAASWNLEFSGSTEHTTNASPTGNLQLNFSKRL